MPLLDCFSHFLLLHRQCLSMISPMYPSSTYQTVSALMWTSSSRVVWSLKRTTAMHLTSYSPNVNWVTYTTTSTPGFSSNWTRFWLRALKRISTTWQNNKRYSSYNIEDNKFWRTLRNACSLRTVTNTSYCLQKEKGSKRMRVEKTMYMRFRQNWVILHASLLYRTFETHTVHHSSFPEKQTKKS